MVNKLLSTAIIMSNCFKSLKDNDGPVYYQFFQRTIQYKLPARYLRSTKMYNPIWSLLKSYVELKLSFFFFIKINLEFREKNYLEY